jgi:hypothetical protein
MGYSDVIARIARWERFYSGEADSRFLVMVNYPGKEEPGRPFLWPDKKEERIDWALRNYESLLEHCREVEDDLVPYLDNLTGTEIFAEALGSKVHRPSDLGSGSGDENKPFALPFVASTEAADKVVAPALGSSSLDYLFDIADSLKSKAGLGVLMRTPDAQSPFDVAALCWDKLDFYPALIDSPEAVLRLCAVAESLIAAFFDEWMGLYGPSFIAHFPTYYMSRGITLSEDEVGAIGADMFETFCLPGLDRLSRRFGGIGIHCCAESRHQWEGFSKVEGLSMLNIHKAELARESLGYFAGKAPMIPVASFQGEGGPADWLASVGEGGRAVFELQAPDREAAKRLVGDFREAAARLG